MTNAVQINTSSNWADNGAIPANSTMNSAGSAPVPEAWEELRENSAIQFDEVELREPEPIDTEPPEPGWFDEALRGFFELLASLLKPIGAFLGISWPVLQWILLGLLALFVLFLVYRLIGPLSRRARTPKAAASEPEWQPDEEESLALLGDADKLAEEGRFDEATRLLLHRSVRQIADARPDWVEPSSTARELAALPALSEAARSAFATISERVERSLFALRSLNRDDWEAARSAYANFALAKIEGAAKTAVPDGAPVRAV